jgi:hypothetical protein
MEWKGPTGDERSGVEWLRENGSQQEATSDDPEHKKKSCVTKVETLIKKHPGCPGSGAFGGGCDDENKRPCVRM